MTSKRDYSNTPKVLEYLNHRVGLHVSASEIAKELELDPSIIHKAIATLRRRGVIEDVGRGIYLYQPGKKIEKTTEIKSDTIFEYLGAIKDGRLIVRNTDTMEIYVLTRL